MIQEYFSSNENARILTQRYSAMKYMALTADTFGDAPKRYGDVMEAGELGTRV